MDTNKEGSHDIDVPWRILGYDPLQCYLCMEKWQIGLVWAYLGSFFGPEGGPLWPQMCGMVHLDTD